MKKLLFGFIVISALFASCGSDCELTALDDIMVGEWTLNGNDLSFNADGTLDDPENAFEASINDIDLLDKTWSTEGDTVLIVTSSNVDPPASLSTNFEIESLDCDEVKANALITFTFKRK